MKSEREGRNFRKKSETPGGKGMSHGEKSERGLRKMKEKEKRKKKGKNGINGADFPKGDGEDLGDKKIEKIEGRGDGRIKETNRKKREKKENEKERNQIRQLREIQRRTRRGDEEEGRESRKKDRWRRTKAGKKEQREKRGMHPTPPVQSPWHHLCIHSFYLSSIPKPNHQLHLTPIIDSYHSPPPPSTSSLNPLHIDNPSSQTFHLPVGPNNLYSPLHLPILSPLQLTPSIEQNHNPCSSTYHLTHIRSPLSPSSSWPSHPTSPPGRTTRKPPSIPTKVLLLPKITHLPNHSILVAINRHLLLLIT